MKNHSFFSSTKFFNPFAAFAPYFIALKILAKLQVKSLADFCLPEPLSIC